MHSHAFHKSHDLAHLESRHLAQQTAQKYATLLLCVTEQMSVS